MRMGSETEFGLLGGTSHARACRIQGAVEATQPHVPAHKDGVFLANGARVYVDLGRQNEYCTPEVESPAALVAHEAAGRRLMGECAIAVGQTLLCANVDHVAKTTWGTHENYECREALDPLRLAQLYPHLVSRVVYTGAGGFNPDHPGVQPVLSPRATRTVTPYNSQGYLGKSLVFAKPETYGPGDRLHVFCGESLLCHLASYLKYATTALVVQCLDQGRQVGPGPFAASPIRALRQVNTDPSLSVRVALADGRRMSALDIQESFAEGVAANLDVLQEWAPTGLERWRQVLGGLRAGDPALAGRLDWLVWNRALVQLADECGYDDETILRLNREARERPKERDRRFISFRAAASELYVRLHLLGPDSLFARFEQHGVADHHLPEITASAIEAAMRTAPPGRPGNRSALVARYAGQAGVRMSWSHVYDQVHERVAVIPSDTGWDQHETWVRHVCRDTYLLNENRRYHALQFVRLGQYSMAEEIYLGLITDGFETAGTRSHLARVMLMTGRIADADGQLALAWDERGEAYPYVVARILFLRALVAALRHEPPGPILEQLRGALVESGMRMEWTILPLLCRWAPALEARLTQLLAAFAAVLGGTHPPSILDAYPAWAVFRGPESHPHAPPPEFSRDQAVQMEFAFESKEESCKPC